ncbi:hypothetical protein BC938DRAFT_473999 [Jimgerdemannia flammicorona]|uniref:Acyltransferase 3 domain-containing protein n=1 Tax=Jimgerdemannia flammicorona TaxID=994334 RepID=A0A433Q3C6_9FUNG|nr:hypothetical protein BC938DRAFT_473999 [Jimgerdemannia flammicorona]
MSPSATIRKRFHAPYLDGIRGLAALSVVYSHSQNLYYQNLFYNTYNMIGQAGVHCFFVLSAFLLVYRGLGEWETWMDSRRDKMEERQGYEPVRLVGAEEADVELGDRTAPEGDIDSTVSPQPHKLVSNPTARSRLSGLISLWTTHGDPVRIWMRFMLRRVMRVYIPYIVLLLLIAYFEPISFAYGHIITPQNLQGHLSLRVAEFIFWSIPPEMEFYLYIPLIVIGYDLLSRLGVHLSRRTHRFSPTMGRWSGRALGLLILLFVESYFLYTREVQNPHKLSGTAQYFLSGSVAAILFHEAMRLDWIPLSEQEEKELEQETKVKSIATSGFAAHIVALLPTRHQAFRLSWDIANYGIFILCLATMPLLQKKILHFGVYMELEWLAGGGLYASLILTGLFSRDGSFVNAVTWSLLRFSGKVSFGIYLLHPIAFMYVNTIPSVGPLAADLLQSPADKANVQFDAVCLSFAASLALGWVFHYLVEKPSMKVAEAVAKRWLVVKKA